MMPLVSRNVTYPPCSDFPRHLWEQEECQRKEQDWTRIVRSNLYNDQYN